MHETLEEETRRVLENMDGEQDGQQPHTDEDQQEAQLSSKPGETIHIHYFPDAIVIVKEDGTLPHQDNTIETTLAAKKTETPEPFDKRLIATGIFFVSLIMSCIAVQLYLVLNPPIATITIFPKSKQVTLTATLQLGRILPPLTLSQSQIVPTTGKGHQDAKSATGYITFYNGLFTSQTVSAGTRLTALNGTQIATDQDALIPAANPPDLGQTTITARAVHTGTQGNIPAYAINTPCCLTAVKVINTQSFYGGHNERNFQTVAKRDIDIAVTQLKTTLSQSVQGALQGQLKPQELLQILPCTPTITADHQPGQEATVVNLTLSQTCSGVAYVKDALQTQATTLLTHKALQTLGTAYSPIRDVHVSVMQTSTPPKTNQVVLAFQAQGTWVYALSKSTQQQIKHFIAGKTKQAAFKLLRSLPGVKSVSIRWGDDSRLPKDSSYISISLLIV